MTDIWVLYGEHCTGLTSEVWDVIEPYDKVGFFFFLIWEIFDLRVFFNILRCYTKGYPRDISLFERFIINSATTVLVGRYFRHSRKLIELIVLGDQKVPELRIIGVR